MMAEQRMRLERIVPASVEEVFRAWTDPELLASWFGPGAFTIASASLDVREGGAYEIVMKPPNGDAMPLVGTYREVAPPRRLAFTWSWRRVWPDAPESLVVVELEPIEGGTRITVTQGDFESDELASPYRAGWEGGLDKLVRRFDQEVEQ